MNILANNMISNKTFHNKTIAIIQARMGSVRLPGKVLMLLAKKPMLWHIVNRLKHCQYIDDIAIATTDKKQDDEISDFAVKFKIKCFRGSETDVLKRYIDAAKKYNADYILRITGDAPLIDPNEIDRLIIQAKFDNADFVMTNTGLACIHEGFDYVSLKALRKIHDIPNLNEYYKEHVVIYLKEKPNFVKSTYFYPKNVFRKRNYHLSVDTLKDFQFMRIVYRKFYKKNNIVSLEEVVNYVEKNPQIKDKYFQKDNEK
jgi:spore coat polysaccharide biosynthesis protein SpsF